MPYVLVTGDQPDSRGDREIVEDLNAALVTRAGISQRKLSDVCLQIVADLVVIESRSEAVVFPAAEQTMRDQRDACVAGNWIGGLRGISNPDKDPDPAERLTTLQLLGNRCGVVHDIEILRGVCNRDPTL